MKENDIQFISAVADFYYTTVDEDHPEGNMSVVAEHFFITRAKVNKILITAGVIDSPLHQDIMKLKAQGYGTDDIVAALGVSATTVKINMPYEKVIYNGESKSAGAGYIEKFRKREKVFLKNVVRRPTGPERAGEQYVMEPQALRVSDPARAHCEYKPGKRGMMAVENDLKYQMSDQMNGDEVPDQSDWIDDPVHLMPAFTEEEARLFKIHPDVMVLHIELDADLSEVKDLAQIKYPSMLVSTEESGTKRDVYTISRDLLVPYNIPLHNLHYAINQALGFTNSHLHKYTLNEHDLRWVTDDKVSRWKKLVGLVFKNPYRDADQDFWDDDYEGGSPKKWMRSKYTGPVYTMIFEESYPYIKDDMRGVKISAKKLEDIWMNCEVDPFAVNEALPVSEILSEDGQDEYEDLDDYDSFMKECIREASRWPDTSQMAQPFVYAFAQTLNYSYDFGDGWDFIIRAYDDVEYLVRDGRVTADGMHEAIRHVCRMARPMVIAADGLPLVEDVGGANGYMEFLRGINGLADEDSMYADAQESLAWAKGNGWPGKIGNLKTLL